MDGTSLEIQFQNSVTGQKKLEKYAQTLTTINTILSGIDQGKMAQVKSSSSSLSGVEKSISKTGKSIDMAFGAAKIAILVKGILVLTKSVMGFIRSSSDFGENFNLFQVAFNGAYSEADQFVNKLSEMYGLDESGLYRAVGVFRAMANAMGYASETANDLSLLLTQMSIDIASLYNIDIERSTRVLQSAMTQQTEAIRAATGADVTQATLQVTLNELGIDRQIRELTQAEKRLVIVISLTKQLSASQGDFGRTIEGTAQQMKVLEEQWNRLTRTIGNIFLPVLKSVLPILNAVLMVLVELGSMLATILGYDPSDFDFFSGDGIGDFNDGLVEADKNVKKLKQGLRGFDKLNNITTPTANSASSGGGIDPKILDAFNKANKEYLKNLDNVKMKATEIRDTIMGWLGFTKQVDEATGNVFWTFEGISGIDFSKISDSWNNLIDSIKLVLEENLLPNLKTFWDEVMIPISLYVINDFLPVFLNLMAQGFETLSVVGQILQPVWDNLWKTFFVPIGKLVGWMAIQLLQDLTKALKGFSDWAIQNQGIVKTVTELLISFLASLWIYNTTKKVLLFIEGLSTVLGAKGLTKTLKLMNIPLLVSVGAFASLAWGIISVVNNWDKMNDMERTLSVLGLLAIAATAAAAAVGALQSAWSLGLAAVAIVGGVWAITNAINSATKKAGEGVNVTTKPLSGGRFADGGLPPVGQLFVANEKGPELIGQIGGQSFVANQDQMMDLLDKKIGSSSNGNQTFIIQVGDEVIATKVLKDLNNMARSNGEPIIIQ